MADTNNDSGARQKIGELLSSLPLAARKQLLAEISAALKTATRDTSADAQADDDGADAEMDVTHDD